MFVPIGLRLSTVNQTSHSGITIGAKPNLYSKAIELVYGGSPIGCVLVERKAQHKGKRQQQQHRTSLDQILVRLKCTGMDEMNGNCWQLPFFTLLGFPLYKAPNRLGEPLPVSLISWSRGVLVNMHYTILSFLSLVFVSSICL